MEKKNYVIIFVFFLSLFVYLFSSKLNKNKFERYLGDYDFSVGKVDVYFRRSTIGYNVGKSSITYSYLVNNLKYTNNYDVLFYKLPDDPKIGDKYIIVYNKNNPENSLLLGGYPVKNSADLENFINSYKNVKFDF